MIKVADGIKESIQGNEIVLFNLNNGEFYGLQDTSYYIWRIIEKYNTYEEIVENLICNYQIPDEKDMKIEVKKLLNDLKKEGLIVIDEDI